MINFIHYMNIIALIKYKQADWQQIDRVILSLVRFSKVPLNIRVSSN